MGLRYEAWTLPWDPAGFKRKVAIIPVLEGSGQGSVGFLAGPEEGSMDVALGSWDRLDEIISDTESSLIRVFDCDSDGSNTVIHEWMAERVSRNHNDSHTVSVSGGNLFTAWERTLVYPWDYPLNPTLQADWLWGGDNLLGNPFFSAAADTPAIFELEITATGGTYTISDGTDTTAPIAFNAQASTIENQLETDLGTVDERCVVTGTSVAPYLRTINIPIASVSTLTLTINTGSLTGGTGTITRTQANQLSYDPWEPAHFLTRPAFPEAYDAFQLSSVQAHSGNRSLFVNPSTIFPLSNRNPGIQQVVSVAPGRIYQSSIWIFPLSATDRFRLGLFTTGEEVIAWTDADGTSLTPNVWNQLVLNDVIIPEGIHSAIFRVAFANSTNTSYEPSGAYFDDGEMNEGLVPTTIGDIWQVLLDDCAIDHVADPRGAVLDWVDYSSFTAALDSGGAAWNEAEVAFMAQSGGSYVHVLDDTFNLGYEAELVPKATPVGGLTHDFHLYNPLGRDSSPSAAINVLQPITDGDALRRIPQYTSLMVRSPEGEYTEQENATLVANFGRFETFRSDGEGSSSITRQLLIDNLFNFEEANRRAVRFTVAEAPGVPRPFIDYRPGDTIPMSLPPGLTKESRRVQRLDYANTVPTQYVVVGSRILNGEAAAFDLVRRMWRRLNRPDGLKDKPAPSLTGGGAGFLFDVAASDAPDWEKALSRRICDGVDDHAEINAAIDDIFNLSDGQAVVQLSSGSFNVSVGQIFVISNVHMRGTGRFTTLFRNQDDGVGSDTPQSGDFLIFVQQDGELSDLGFSTTFSFLATCVVSEYAIIHDIHHFGGDAHIFVYYHGTIYPSHDLSSWANYAKSMLLYNENWVDHHGIFHSGGGTTLWFDVQAWGTGTLSGVHIDSTGAHAIVLEEVGNLNITGLNVSTGNPFTPNDWAVFHLLGTPGNLTLSDINIEGAGYLVWAGTGEGTWGGVSIAHVTGKIWHSVVDVPGGTVGGVLSSAFALRHVDLECGDSDGINLVIGSGEVDLSDLHLTAIEGVGINLVRQSTTIPVSQVRIHDVTLDADQHGVLADGVELHLSKAQITAGAGAGNTYDAVHLTGEMERPVIEHNNILSASQLRYGINIASPAVVRAIVVGNSGDDPGDFGTDAINDQGTDTQLAYPADATYGDNFFRSGSTSGADQIEPVVPPTTFPNREFESARPVIPVQS